MTGSPSTDLRRDRLLRAGLIASSWGLVFRIAENPIGSFWNGLTSLVTALVLTLVGLVFAIAFNAVAETIFRGRRPPSGR